jgi:hypothetical protein
MNGSKSVVRCNVHRCCRSQPSPAARLPEQQHVWQSVASTDSDRRDQRQIISPVLPTHSKLPAGTWQQAVRVQHLKAFR